jgi:predicted nucleic acid-binding protein
MDLLFFDTSALVKRYYKELGTEKVDELIEQNENIVITSLTIIETISAFRRKYNREEIDRDDVDGLLAAFFEEALNEFIIIPMEESIQQFSFDLILENDLRTLDSLQLSAALSLTMEDTTVSFVTADADLATVAQHKGLKTINPNPDSKFS